MLNALTVDVEDYFQVNAFKDCISPSSWDSYPLRVVENTTRILDLFDEFGVKATFFILGWVAERSPQLVRDIDARGHNVASHGYAHQLVYSLTPEEFRDDVSRTKAILEDCIGKPVVGYRAPSYSITRDSLWALDILAETGHTFDSSIFPTYHDVYGIPDAQRQPHTLQTASGDLLEFPLTTYPISFLGKRMNLPVAGGGYFRLFPVSLVSGALRNVNAQEKLPVIFYFHPWEVDPDQPRVPNAGLRSRFRHYVNLHKTEDKLRVLFSRLSFGTVPQALEAYGIC